GGEADGGDVRTCDGRRGITRLADARPRCAAARTFWTIVRHRGAARCLPHVDGNDRRPAPRAILTGVEAFAAQGMGDQSAVAVEVRPEAAVRRAAARDGGSDLPRFSARRRMPLQAVAL